MKYSLEIIVVGLLPFNKIRIEEHIKFHYKPQIINSILIKASN